MSTSKTVGTRRRGLFGLLAGGLLTATAATVIAVPLAGLAAADCDQDVGSSIDAYLQRHPDLHQQLQDKSRGEGGNGSVIDYLNRHPDVRQHLIELSHACPP